ncbi:MAG TPA: AAC(3) family N-acetyltransferase [bacterium]|nr:AAC(3) family N-acetyltransferase [bacterium]HPN44379.1 AAC(3) family N-acetyltransferase [bacterium]
MSNYKAGVIKQISDELLQAGVRRGGVLLVHSSLKSLGKVPGGAETVICGLLEALGPDGTLLMPALSYEKVNRDDPVFNITKAPVCIGAIPEYFRKRSDTIRSMHPTHSICGVGKKAQKILEKHINDSTPCGPNSPFRQLRDLQGQILMLGCGLKPNTSMHAIEELVEPEYLFGFRCWYTLVDASGNRVDKAYLPHDFRGWEQRYDRVANILTGNELKTGKVLEATVHIIEATALWKKAYEELQKNPLYFVDKK